MPTGRWLVLFDIDGTLLKCGPQIRDIFQSALEDTYGTAGPIDSYSFAGRTDHGIVGDLMVAAGLGASDVHAHRAAFETLYLERLEERLDGALMTVLPGVPDLLQRLSARQDVLLGLLTGNLERGAAIKLSRLGLAGYFSLGAYGDGLARRSDLPPVALERARHLHGAEIDRSQVLIIGDSVLDVQCAHDHDIRCVAVTTGYTTRQELENAGADWIIADLLEVERCHQVFRGDAAMGL